MLAVEANVEKQKTADRVSGRLLDFFSSLVPWQRRLWSVGAILSLEEVLEASRGKRQGILGEPSLKNVIETTRDTIRSDRGFTRSEQGALQKLLSGVLVHDSVTFARGRKTA